jgi:hypothetical protein
MSADMQRVIVALDAASENRAALGAAARLAERWGMHLHGMFVEDDDLIRLAHLPFARQVTLGVGVETLDLRAAQRQMRAAAERARRELAAAAHRHGLEWSFEIVHGANLAVAEGDFLVAGTTTRPIGDHFRVEGRWWRIDDPGAAVRLLAHQAGDREGAAAVLLRDRGAGAERLLATAGRLAAAHDARLIVICTPELAQAAGFKGWLDQCLAESGVQIDLELLPENAMRRRRITELRCRLVALEAGAEEARPDRLREMVARLACDVLVVR